MKTARVHHAARRRGGVAARGAGAAARAHAAHRRADARMPQTIRNHRPRRGVPAGSAAIGLDRWPQRADRLSLGARAMPSAFADTLRNWSRSQPDVILAHGSAAVAALQQATRTVPIVFLVAVDPVGTGFVASLARPGGNVTGFIAVRIQHRAGNGRSCSKRSRRA